MPSHTRTPTYIIYIYIYIIYNVAVDRKFAHKAPITRVSISLNAIIGGKVITHRDGNLGQSRDRESGGKRTPSEVFYMRIDRIIIKERAYVYKYIMLNSAIDRRFSPRRSLAVDPMGVYNRRMI